MEQPLQTLPEGSYFEIPHRSGRPCAFGKLQGIGTGSCRVRVARNDEHGGWESTNWSPNTMVFPATAEQFNTQRLSEVDTGQRVERKRSEATSPVKLVHQICDELIPGANRIAPTKMERQAVMDECAKQGINPNTAKTQYYHWRKGR